MSKPKKNRPDSEAALAEMAIMIPVYVLGIAKLVAEETGERSGSFPCPRCSTGTLRYSIASNGHGKAVCDRRYEQDGQTVSCINVME